MLEFCNTLLYPDRVLCEQIYFRDDQRMRVPASHLRSGIQDGIPGSIWEEFPILSEYSGFPRRMSL